MPDRLAPVPMIFAEFAPLDRTDELKVIGVEMGDHLSSSNTPFAVGTRDRRSSRGRWSRRNCKELVVSHSANRAIEILDIALA